MIIYEITAIVRADLIEKYMSEVHIPDLLKQIISAARNLRTPAKIVIEFNRKQMTKKLWMII